MPHATSAPCQHLPPQHQAVIRFSNLNLNVRADAGDAQCVGTFGSHHFHDQQYLWHEPGHRAGSVAGECRVQRQHLPRLPFISNGASLSKQDANQVGAPGTVEMSPATLFEPKKLNVKGLPFPDDGPDITQLHRSLQPKHSVPRIFLTNLGGSVEVKTEAKIGQVGPFLRS